MGEDKDIPASEETTKVVLEPIGVRVIGNLNPSTLTEEQFRSSPDLLFHGASENFNFSSKFDYRSKDYYAKSDGSQTLGEGFYTTAERGSAVDYSVVRQFKQDTTPVVLEVLPYQARVLDFRAKSDATKNASVPKDLFDNWYMKFKAYFEDSESRKNLPWHVHAGEAEYMSYLIKLKQVLPTPDLRVMLGTAPTGTRDISSLNYPSPPWMRLFSNFMVEQGYDGIVYNEGGEGRNAKNHTSYTFYNLEKIGTFESWQQHTKSENTISSDLSSNSSS